MLVKRSTGVDLYKKPSQHLMLLWNYWKGASSQRAHGAILMSLLRKNDTETSFWRDTDFVIKSRARYVGLRQGM